MISVLRDREGEGRLRAGSLLTPLFPFPIPFLMISCFFRSQRMSSDSVLEGRKERKKDPLGEFWVLYPVKRELGNESNNAAVVSQIIQTARVSRTKKQSIYFTWKLYSVPHYPPKRTSGDFTDTQTASVGTLQHSSCISGDGPVETICLGLSML